MRLFWHSIITLVSIHIFCLNVFAENQLEQLKKNIDRLDTFYDGADPDYLQSLRSCRAETLMKKLTPEELTFLLELLEQNIGLLYVTSQDSERKIKVVAWYYRTEIDCVQNNPDSPKGLKEYMKMKERTLSFPLNQL